jgi:putative transcriptional regulator
MEDGSFEWDEEKAASNAAKHGVRFEAARSVFDDPFAIEYVDDRQDYGQDRFILIGMASDWRRFDAMSEEERHRAALDDPDARPLGPEDFKRMKRTPRAKIIRRALRLSQEEFAARFQIPIGTLRDWEQGRKEPDAAARAYLTVIGRIPSAVTEALAARP